MMKDKRIFSVFVIVVLAVLLVGCSRSSNPSFIPTTPGDDGDGFNNRRGMIFDNGTHTIFGEVDGQAGSSVDLASVAYGLAGGGTAGEIAEFSDDTTWVVAAAVVDPLVGSSVLEIRFLPDNGSGTPGDSGNNKSSIHNS